MTFFLTDTENLWSFPFFDTTDDFRLLLIWTYPGYYKPLECLHQENSYALFLFFLETITNHKFSLFQPFGFYQWLFHPFFFKFHNEKLTYLSRNMELKVKYCVKLTSQRVHAQRRSWRLDSLWTFFNEIYFSLIFWKRDT